MKVITTAFLAAVLLALLSSTVLAETWYVDAANKSGGDGLSWETAYIDLREVLDRIDDGDEVWLAKGHYRLADGTFEETGNPYPNRFIVDKEVFIRGGFDGSESDPSQRSPLDPSETILDGDRLGDDVTPGSNPADNAGRVVHVQISLDRLVALEGVTIQAGRLRGVDWTGVAGIPQELIIRNCRIVYNPGFGLRTRGVTLSVENSLVDGNGNFGLFISDGDATIEETEVTLNEAVGIRFTILGTQTLSDYTLSIVDSESTFNGDDGLSFQGLELSIDSSVFSWNGDDGANMTFRGAPNSDSASVCEDSTFSGNERRAVAAFDFPDLSLADSQFNGNLRGLHLEASSVRATDCEFSQNAINGNGGGIYMERGSRLIGNNVLIAENRSFASGMRLRRILDEPGCELLLANARFLGNQETALFIDSANNAFEEHQVTLLNPVFVGNVNRNIPGGAIISGGSLSIFQGSFVGNEAVGSGDVIAEVVGFPNSSTDLVQCLFYDNDASGGDPIAINHTATNNLNGPRPDFARPPNSGDGDWTTPDDNDYGDLNLRGGSPGIDAGQLRHLTNDWSDLDGDGDQRETLPLDAQLRPRIIGRYPDIGAYESRERNLR